MNIEMIPRPASLAIIAMALAMPVMAASQTLAAKPSAAAIAAPASPVGIWRNPKNTVHMEIRPCGAASCGYVIWSTPKADADARKGSGKPLVGQQILREFVWDKRGYYKGKVYAPDVNLTVSGTAEPIGDAGLKARGCLVGRMLCKTQVWKRLGGSSSSHREPVSGQAGEADAN